MMEQLERLKLICQDAIAKEPSSPTEKERGYTIALQHVLKILEEDPSPTTPTDNNTKNNMKLYTERQLRQAYRNAYLHGYRTKAKEDAFVESQTPIKLPSDEEIRLKALDVKSNVNKLLFHDVSFQFGAHWVIEQIEKQK